MCFSVGATSQTSTSNQNQYGTTSPVLSADWTKAYNNYAGSINPTTGANPLQQQGIDWLQNNMANSPVWGAVNSTNTLNNNLIGGLTGISGMYNDMATQVAPQVQAYEAAPVTDVTAQNGGDFMQQYMNPYDQAVVQSAVGNYNTNVDRTLNQLRAGRDASGAFGDRAAVADATYLGGATQGLGSLVSGLYQQGFNTAAGLGQSDANRFLQAAQGNQSSNLQRNMFNAGQQSQAAQFNANATLQNNAQRLQALQGIQQTAAQMSGLSQNVVNNIITANGVDMQAAQALVAAGTVSQGQLAAVVNAAAQGNGSQFTQNTNTNSSSDTISASANGPL